MDNYNHSSRPNARWILIGLLVIAGVYLIVDHGQHLVPFLPFTFLLGCLVMHLFMHGSHGGHGGNDNHSGHSQNDQKSS